LERAFSFYSIARPIQVKAYQQSIPSGETYGMTLSSQALFTFKLKTPFNQEFMSLVNPNLIDWRRLKHQSEFSTKQITEDGSLNDDEKLVKLQQLLLSMMKDNGLDQLVGLYQGTATGIGENTNIKWVEKVLDGTNPPKEIPCTNYYFNTFIIMKNLFKTILILITITCYSQEGLIVPLSKTYLNYQSGVYEKDLNNEFNPFIGTWYLINNNIKYTLVFQKMEHLLVTNSPAFYYYTDEVVCKYEVLNLSTNEVLYTTMNVTAYDDFDITSLGGVHNGALEFDFFDRPRCNHLMRIRLYNMMFQTGTTIPYQVRYYNFGSDGFFEQNGCPYTTINEMPTPLPLGSFTLTKQ
jgi:hypothetical protein